MKYEHADQVDKMDEEKFASSKNFKFGKRVRNVASVPVNLTEKYKPKGAIDEHE